MKILVTGGFGFIGSALIRKIIRETKYEVLNIDSITNVASPEAIEDCAKSGRYNFARIDICDKDKLLKAFKKFKPDAVMHLAAESHVDRSIKNPYRFIFTNIIGTFNMLEVSTKYINIEKNIKKFKFLHVSTDEVFGSLKKNEKIFTEKNKYFPNSPYSASKASSDHLVRAWNKTYGLPTVTTYCSNNYGPWQNPEKLIPTIISNALKKNTIPIYGKGNNVRDWIYVDDHISGLLLALNEGKVGQNYNIGSNSQISNIELANKICKILDKRLNNKSPHNKLIKFVKDRPGHDFRYAISAKKIKKNLNFSPKFNFNKGLNSTVDWYIENSKWLLSKHKL